MSGYITKEEVSAIRLKLKETFGKTAKFSVRMLPCCSVKVSVLSSEVDLSENTSDGFATVNYRSYKTRYTTEAAREFLGKVIDVIKTAPLEVSNRYNSYYIDSLNDEYGSLAYPFDLTVGTWNKAYETVSDTR